MDFAFKPLAYADLMAPTKPAIKPTKRVVKKFDSQTVARIIGISFPEEVDPTNLKYKARFSIGIKYQDLEGKKRHKTIFFGTRGLLEYIDHGDVAKRDLTMSRMRKWASPFDKNFYRAHLLNGLTNTLCSNYARLVAMLQIKST